jgi:hypothetical protein
MDARAYRAAHVRAEVEMKFLLSIWPLVALYAFAVAWMAWEAKH